jgi:hypothetical protein
MNPFKLFVFTIVIAGVFSYSSPGVHGDLVNITDGTSTFQWNPDDGTNTISSAYGNYSFTFEPMLRYTNSADGLKTRSMANFLGSGVRKATVSNSVVNVGESAVMNVSFGTQNGLSPAVADLDMLLVFTISTNEYGGVLDYAMVVDNVSGGDLDVELFQYYDWDVTTNQNSGSDYVWRGFEGFVQVGSGGPEQQVFHGTGSLENWEVAPWDSIKTNLLANGDLSNNGTPFATADMTAAFGWDLGTMADGSTQGVTMLIEGIPEPSSALLLTLGCLATSVLRRRK